MEQDLLSNTMLCCNSRREEEQSP